MLKQAKFGAFDASLASIKPYCLFLCLICISKDISFFIYSSSNVRVTREVILAGLWSDCGGFSFGKFFVLSLNFDLSLSAPPL